MDLLQRLLAPSKPAGIQTCNHRLYFYSSSLVVADSAFWARRYGSYALVYDTSHLEKIVICCFDKQKEKLSGTQSHDKLMIYVKEEDSQ